MPAVSIQFLPQSTGFASDQVARSFMATIDRTTITKPSPIVEDEQGQLRARQGISREVVSELSKIKGEPDWMAEKRLKSLEIFERKPVPTWGPDLSGLNLDDLVLYSPPTAGRFNSWDDVPADMKQTYEDLGIPQAEREHLAGVVGVWRQEPVYEGLKEEYAKQGILFCSMDTAITEYPELVQKYFMTKCVPAQDNKFSALHGAVWSGGAFVYIPPGVKCDLPLQSYFRMEGAGEGTFEHTLIIADEGAEVNYIEGYTAQTCSVNSMHSAVVEIFVHEGAKARYTTVQNWSKDVYNLNTKRAIVDAEGTVEWVGGSMGAKYVMLYPGSFLMGEGARADHLNVGVAGKGVHKDTGAKVVHLAPNTTSNILAKSISKDGGIMGYRGLVKMGHNSAGSKARVQCDGLMMDGESKSDTWPDIQIQNPHVTVAHEATVGRISDDQLFYMGSRGFSEDDGEASSLQRGKPLVIEFRGFCRPNSVRTLPYLQAWHERYAQDGLRTVGVHSPGFPPARDEDAVRAAVARLGIEYPVLIDRELELWRDYENQGWPARYLFDGRARLFEYHYGEGAYAETELAIQELLGVEREPLAPLRPEDAPDARLLPQTEDQQGAYSGPYEAGGVWAVLEGSGTVRANG